MADKPAYVASYSWALSIPELADLIRRAEAENWTEEAFLGAVKATEYWRLHNETERDWYALQGSDPAKAHELADAKYKQIHRWADELGVLVTADDLNTLTDQAMRAGVSDDLIKESLAHTFKLSTLGGKDHPAGVAATTVQQINSLVSDYAVQISDQTKEQWTQQVLAGTITVDDFKGYLSTMAKSRYAGLTQALDRGITVRQYAEPYVQMAARELEIDPSSVDLSDPKWQSFLDFRDPKTGEAGQMTMAEWLHTIRTDSKYGYDQTTGARQTSAQLATALAQTFGAIG